MSEQLILRLKRVLPVPRATVYRALSDPGELAKWWGPRGFTVPGVDFDPRAGGNYRISMQPPDGDIFHLAGEFLEVEPPARLTYTFRWDPPDPDDRQTVTKLTLQERDGHTELLLIQGVFATDERLALHRQGWTETLDRLEELLLAEGRLRASNHWIGGTRTRSVVGERELDAGEDPNPAEYLLHALAASLTTSIVREATASEVGLEWVESTTAGDSGLDRIELSFRVAGDAPDNRLRELVERAKKRSGVYDVVTKGVPVAVDVLTA